MKRILFLLLLLPGFILAQPQQSENFRITKSVIDAGGAQGASADFGLYSAFGQSTPIGAQSSENFVLYAGYLSLSFAVSPLSPIQALVIRVAQPDVILNWPSVNGADQYYIYRDTTAVFTPSPLNRVAIVEDTTYTDANVVITSASLHQYYVVSAHEWVHPLTMPTDNPDVRSTTKLSANPNDPKRWDVHKTESSPTSKSKTRK